MSTLIGFPAARKLDANPGVLVHKLARQLPGEIIKPPKWHEPDGQLLFPGRGRGAGLQKRSTSDHLKQCN